MNKLILASALSAGVLLLSACGDNDADDAAADSAVVDDTATADTAAPAGGATTAASADWPAGTRIVEEGGTTYRVDPGGTRVAIEDNSWRVVTEDGVRYRVSPQGTRIRIDDEGLDVDGIDVDLGRNDQGNLDLDVSTNGTDASNDQND
jgi:hypothetical protein